MVITREIMLGKNGFFGLGGNFQTVTQRLEIVNKRFGWKHIKHGVVYGLTKKVL